MFTRIASFGIFAGINYDRYSASDSDMVYYLALNKES